MMESKIRSVLKTLTWRITGSGATFLLSYLLTDNANIAGTIALLQMATNTILYYVHERIWNNIKMM